RSEDPLGHRPIRLPDLLLAVTALDHSCRYVAVFFECYPCILLAKAEIVSAEYPLRERARSSSDWLLAGLAETLTVNVSHRCLYLNRSAWTLRALEDRAKTPKLQDPPFLRS